MNKILLNFPPNNIIYTFYSCIENTLNIYFIRSCLYSVVPIIEKDELQNQLYHLEFIQRSPIKTTKSQKLTYTRFSPFSTNISTTIVFSKTKKSTVLSSTLNLPECIFSSKMCKLGNI